MDVIKVVSYLLVIEVILITVCLVGLIAYYFISLYRTKAHTAYREELRKKLLFYLSNQEEFKIEALSGIPYSEEDLLIVLESFDRRFADDKWRAIKHQILTDQRLARARKMTTSRSWIKRNWGIRFLRLAPHIQDEPIILKLLDDPSSLVRIQAAFCAVKLATQPLIRHLLYRMSKESVLGRYPYRDALVRSDKAIFSLVEEIMLQEKDENLKSICLDILSTHVNENLIPVIEDYLFSKNLNNKVAAIKILANFPRKESIHYLTQFLQNKDWQVRAEAARGLGQLMATTSLPDLAKALNDSIWDVRLEAALALKKMGEEGFIILSRQDPDIHLQAYETAQYVLALPNK